MSDELKRDFEMAELPTMTLTELGDCRRKLLAEIAKQKSDDRDKPTDGIDHER